MIIMKNDLIMNRAISLAKSKKYDSAIRMLESGEHLYEGTFRYAYLMAVICLYSGNNVGAFKNFNKAREIKMRDPHVLLGMAALYMKRGETEKAINCYLDVKDIDPKNKTASKALAIIRKHAGLESFAVWRDSGQVVRLYPPLPSVDFSLKRVLVPGVSIIGALALCFGLLLTFDIFPANLLPAHLLPGNLFPGRQAAAPVNRSAAQFMLTAAERAAPVQLAGVYRHIFTVSEAVETYDRALALFTAGRDEPARVYLNTILESNASDGLQNRAIQLLSFLDTPGFATFQRADNFSFSEAIMEPAIFRGVHVIWRGMATNIHVEDDFTSFDFLIGYDTRTTLEGIVPVVFNMPVFISNERPLEVLGRITPIGAFESAIRLDGISIHQPARFTQ
ncbi:MAG: tetratricopeptide repeat protein [Spirochaetes bacterium]|nr:tetratricopeptide repeat protein [Spirochaetota bacterium]